MRLFHEEGVRVYDSKPISKGGRCERTRVENILLTMTADDIEHMNITSIPETKRALAQFLKTIKEPSFLAAS